MRSISGELHRAPFHDERHREMWSLVDQPEDVLDAIAGAPPWPHENRNFAAL
jgi:hypothetical protein